MADFIPTNIIQTPDFAGLAKQRIDRQRAEETSKNAYLDQFEQTQGMYLDGDRPAVQEAWNKVQSTMDMVAENDSPEARRRLKQVYGEYTQVAGTAQVLADQHREQVAAFKSDPTKFAMSGSDFLNWDKDFRLTKRGYNDMLSALDNPNVLPSASAYALLNPYEQAKTLMADTSNVAATFYDKYGNLDEQGLRTRVDDLARKKVLASPEAFERAVIWGATTANNPQSGFIGDGDGKINSLEELEMIKNLPDEERQKYADAYINSLVDDYIGLTPSRSTKTDSGKKPLAVSSVSIQAAGGQNVEFVTLPGYVDTNYEVEDEEGNVVSATGKIIQIGKSPDNRIFLTIEREVETGDYDNSGKPITKVVTEYRPATQTEMDKIMSKYGNTYDFSTLEPSSQEAPAEAEAPTQQAAPTEQAQPEATAEAPAEAPVEGPKDSLGLGLGTAAAQEEAAPEAAAPVEQAPTEQRAPVTEGVESKADETLSMLSGGVSAKQLEEDKPYMFKEAQQLQKDIATTKQQIRDAEAAGKDTAELNKNLEEQKRVLKKVNEVNRKISERRERRGFEEGLPELATEDQPAKEPAKEAAPSKEAPAEEEVSEEYIVVGNNVYYKKDYENVAGKKTGRGNYPETFEEYADQMGVAVMNTKDNPVSTQLDEVTVTAESLEPSIVKEENKPVQAGGAAAPKAAPAALNTDSYYEHLLGAEGGKTSDPKDNAANVPENADAPLDPSDPKGKRRFHTNKGLQYAKFKEWAKENNIPESKWQDRFLNLTDKEVKSIVDDYTKASGSDNFESPMLRALFTSNAWGSGKVFRADFSKGRSPEYRAIIDWLQESTGVDFSSTTKLSKAEAKAIEDFYNKDPEGFVREFTKRRKIHNKTLDTYERFGDGWDKRADDLEGTLLAELGVS